MNPIPNILDNKYHRKSTSSHKINNILLNENINDQTLVHKSIPIISSGNQKTTISTEDSEQAAKGAETISSQFNNTDNLRIGFNSMFILDALNSIKSENITMFLNGSLNAAILSETSPDKKMDKLVLLMPIRLND